MARHNELGNEGELMARSHLEKEGYIILDSNWRSKHKEIDIVAKDGNILVIVEVKSRKQDTLTDPEDAVDNKKIRNLVYAAETYVKSHNLDIDIRFDIITIYIDSKGNYSVNHIKDAFWPPVNI